MYSALKTIPQQIVDETILKTTDCSNIQSSCVGFINVKKYYAHEVFLKRMNEWPKTSQELFFNEPNTAYSRFIKLCYQLNKKSIDLRACEHHADKQRVQKIFAYLLHCIKAENKSDEEKRQMFFFFNLLVLRPDLITSKEDVQYILNDITQEKRAWIKVCISQMLRNKRELIELQQKRTARHDKILDATYIASELANIGIVLQEVVGGVFLGQHWVDIGIAVSCYSNPLIYLFKVLQRSFKLAGRTFWRLEFAEDEVGINPQQNFWDGVSAIIFLFVTVLLIINTPILTALAWVIAPIGLTIVWKSEYGYQNQCAHHRQKNMRDSQGLFDEQAQAEAARVAGHKQCASWALLGVIVFICLGMLTANAAVVPGLNIIFNEFTVAALTMISGIALASLAVFRALNFLWERKGLAIKAAAHTFFTHPLESAKTFFIDVGHYLVHSITRIPAKIVDTAYYLTQSAPVTSKGAAVNKLKLIEQRGTPYNDLECDKVLHELLSAYDMSAILLTEASSVYHNSKINVSQQRIVKSNLPNLESDIQYFGIDAADSGVSVPFM